MSAGTHPVTDNDFEAEVLKSTVPVLVDFWAEWCGPCKMIGPVLEELSGPLANKVRILKMNVDENPVTPSKYGIRSIPTLMLFKGGQMTATKIGAVPKAQLQQWIESSV